MSSIYSTILEHLIQGESLTISTRLKATSVRRSIYKELQKLRESLEELGQPCPIAGVKVVTAGEGHLLIEATSNSPSTDIKIISTHKVGEEHNEEEL